MKSLFLSLVFIFAAANSMGASQAVPQDLPSVDSLSLDRLPGWTDIYNENSQENRRNFDIKKLMSQFNLSRMQALQVQSLYRKYVEKSTPGLALSKAVTDVREGRLDHINLTRLAAAKFTVVFDLDETLYDQTLTEAYKNCADVVYTDAASKTHYIKTTPHAVDVIRRINQLGGAVVLFSANLDAPTQDNLRAWKVDDTNLLDSPLIAGVLTNSSLILQGTGESTLVTTPSKDLRVFDETLKKVIIVDDNPIRLFQSKNYRLIRNFDGRAYCSSADPKFKGAFDLSLPEVVTDIEDSLEAMQKSPTLSFVGAFLPYSLAGKVTWDWMQQSGLYSSAEEIKTWIRGHPELINPKFP